LPDEDLSIGAVELIFKEVIAKGKGIEINTSDVRYGQKTTIPTLGMLKRYRALGGEIVTIGSDSHGVRYIGEGISRGQELLREAGFTYQATYENRKPIFHKIGG
jgi:histidinol-phosphatase (PHP family)